MDTLSLSGIKYLCYWVRLYRNLMKQQKEWLTMRNMNVWLVLLLITSFFLCVGFLFWGSLSGGMVHDGEHYDLLAKSLLQTQTFPSAYRSPGYPVLIAVFYKIFGQTPIPLFLFQAILSTASIGLLFLLGKDILGKERAGYAFIVAALMGLNPEIAAYSVVMLRETVTFFLLVLSAWLCLGMLMRDWRYGIGLGFAMAALMYIRQEACLMIFVMIAGGLFRSEWRRRGIFGGSVATGIIALCILPWMIYCGLYRGYGNMQSALDSNLFVRTWYFSTSGKVEPELRRHIVDVTDQKHLSPEQVKRYIIPPLLVSELPKNDVLAESALYKKLGRIARENLQNHRKQYFIDCVKAFKDTMGGYWLAWWKPYWDAPDFSTNIRQGQWWVVIIKMANRVVWPAVVLPLCLIGIISFWRRHDHAAWPMTLLLVGTMVSLVPIILFVEGSPRLRQAYDGFFYLGMIYGLHVLVTRYGRSSEGSELKPEKALIYSRNT